MKQTIHFSVYIHDCQVETFTCGGHGGAGKDTSNTGVRVKHLPSGAVAKSCDERSQLANKRAAFGRMARTHEFRQWARMKARSLFNREHDEVQVRAEVEQRVDEAMNPKNIRCEVRDPDGTWTSAPELVSGDGYD